MIKKLHFLTFALLMLNLNLVASVWGDDVMVHAGEPTGMTSAAGRSGGVIYAAVTDNTNPNFPVVIYQSPDLGQTWSAYTGTGLSGQVLDKVKMISNDLDSVYVFYMTNNEIHYMNVESGNAGVWNGDPVRDFDVATTYDGSLFLLVDVLGTNQIRRFGSFDGGTTWGGSSALMSNSGAHPKIYKSALSDTIIINYFGGVNADTATSTIRAARYVHTGPGTFATVLSGFTDVVVTDGTPRKEFMSVYSMGTVWLFYTEGDTVQTIKYKVSTDTGISYGAENTLASNQNVNHHWLDAKQVFGSFAGHGAGIVWYSDSLQSGTATPQSDKIVYAEAGYQAPFTFSAPVSISEHAPVNSSLNYKPAMVAIPKATFDDIGVLWTGMDSTGINVYWDLMSFIPISIADDLISENSIILFPNPASDELIISLNDLSWKKLNIEIKDITGKIINHFISGVDTDKIKLNVSDYKAGIYFVNIKNNSGVITKKFVVSR
jgi:hypothetical protein